MAPYRAVSLFSGCGGFCEGVRLAGFSVRAAVELDRYAVQTYRQNFPEVPLFHGDVQDFVAPESSTWREEGARFGHLSREPVDLVFGGPPCQGFSQIGPRAIDDPRNGLYREFIRVLTQLRPKVLLMENVPNMLAIAGGRFKGEVLEAMAEAGYRNVGVAVVTASDFGVAQVRRRAIFFGVRDDLDLGMEAGEFLSKTLEGQKQTTPTVWQILRDLPEQLAGDDGPMRYPAVRRASTYARELRMDCEGRWYGKAYKQNSLSGPVELHNHHTKGMQDRRRALIAHLDPGANAKSLPADVWSGKRAEKWRRLHLDRPSHTILAQMHRDMSEWIHPLYERWITVREAARLQSFHDGFVFKSSEWQMLKQVGNAVPPLMARALATVADAALVRMGERKSR
ncbi:DNA cytosine methyltransferase [Nocardia sp. NPDC050412]|uniref:DNA cytosine methyltransferase n=1 Tax=Nocardia sp. NPDC050412 TaxID=3364320 RepID=UPI0037BC291C